MTSRIDLQGLQKELDGFKNRVERWSQGVCSSAESARDAHFQRIREFQAAIRSLEQQQEELLRRAEEVRQRLASEHAQVEQLQEELGRIRAEQDALPPLVQELKEALDAEAADFARREAVIKDTSAAKQHKLQALRQAAALYKQRLGLAFEHASGEGEQLNVVFTHVDPRDHGRGFHFAVEVQEDSSYAVSGCQPSVERLPELLVALNSGGQDFSGFVRALRREFQGVVAQEMQQLVPTQAVAAA
ncbi:hypothetical protein N2152v2_010035 [Parachlorella kessleri]